jgi:hypothetical protein
VVRSSAASDVYKRQKFICLTRYLEKSSGTHL